VAKEPQKLEEDDGGGEFADFLADVSQEIAQRVESLDAGAKPVAEEAKKTPAAGEVRKKTPSAAEAGLIVEWPNIVDRMIEEIR
jgi:hypothetical protein